MNKNKVRAIRMKYQWEEGEVSILIQLQFCPSAQTIPFENSGQHRGCGIAENTHTQNVHKPGLSSETSTNKLLNIQTASP